MVWRMGRGGAYRLLESLLREEAGMTALPEMARRPGGKPWFPACPGLCFNVSHSGELALCAVSEREVGCDIELVRPRGKALPAYVLDSRELNWFRDRGERWEDMYALWTMKEARVKCTGEGLVRAPRTIAVPLLSAGQTEELDGFTFTALGGEGWRGAVCQTAGASPGRSAGEDKRMEGRT